MNYYLILGIPVDADEETIRHAFRMLARRYHPDAGSGSSVEKFRQIFEAYETLRDPARRALYDNSLQASQARRGRARPITVEPLRPEPTRAEPIRPDFAFRRDIIEQLFDDLFADFRDDPFLRRPFPRW
jgi:curved DNA-binding protein CbpA